MTKRSLKKNNRGAQPGFFCMVAIAVLFAACSKHKLPTKDNPSGYNWDSPYQKEPAHMRPYQQNGKTYHPMKPDEAIDHKEKGYASWYGKDFHGLYTSNGEKYNMYALTAAHKTLPLGLYVRVTNLKNGKQTVVKLNDRGPFVANRIIDLSYAAAKEIAMENDGVVPVVVEALGFPVYDGKNVTYKKPKSYETGTFRLQIAAFKNKDNARRLSDEMRKKLSIAVKVVEYQRGDETFFRVRVGSFSTIRDAENYKDRLKDIGYSDAFIVGD